MTGVFWSWLHHWGSALLISGWVPSKSRKALNLGCTNYCCLKNWHRTVNIHPEQNLKPCSLKRFLSRNVGSWIRLNQFLFGWLIELGLLSPIRQTFPAPMVFSDHPMDDLGDPCYPLVLSSQMLPAPPWPAPRRNTTLETRRIDSHQELAPLAPEVPAPASLCWRVRIKRCSD